jgi:hypothetical protein
VIDMLIWRLVPTDTLDPNWQVSSHRQPVIVRAAQECTARDAAAAAFSVPQGRSVRGAVRVPPWMLAHLERAEPIEHSSYSLDGPTEVLAPSFRLR